MSLKDATTPRLRYEVKEGADSIARSDWVVEAIDHESEGEVHVARFTGPRAEERAHEYAEWKNHAA